MRGDDYAVDFWDWFRDGPTDTVVIARTMAGRMRDAERAAMSNARALQDLGLISILTRQRSNEGHMGVEFVAQRVTPLNRAERQERIADGAARARRGAGRRD